ncbi:hypothetical protein DST30_11555 [Salmonella enterica subsp. enterica serovar Panama]|nr:hypothetical protein [Salmonella enterica subsp. enterica serovar Panama]
MTKISPYDVAKLVIRDTIGVRYIKGKYKKGCNKGKRFTARITQTSERRIMDVALDSLVKAMPWLMLD